MSGTVPMLCRTSLENFPGASLPNSAPVRLATSGAPKSRLIRGGLGGWRAKSVVAYIGARLAARVSVAELARRTGLSQGHFCRAFKETFGVSVRRYLIIRRIESAQQMMLHSGLPLSEIALSCGFFDQPHLSRTFRSIVGEAAATWRRAHRDDLGVV
jgi:transcriptional regulator GlxA family with amidase domain